MTYRDFKNWVGLMDEEELDRKLTPALLLEAADPKMVVALDKFLGELFLIAPDHIKDDAMRLLVLLHLPY